MKVMRLEKESIERLCIVDREVKPRACLIRFVLDPQGCVTADLGCKLPGRGVWVTATHKAVSQALKKHAFAKAFATQTTEAPDLADQIRGLLRKQALSLLSLAKKAGEVIIGFSKIESRLQQQGVVALFHAREAAADGCRKLDRLAVGTVVKITIFDTHELELAFGRENVVHACLTQGGLAEKFLSIVHRIESYEA